MSMALTVKAVSPLVTNFDLGNSQEILARGPQAVIQLIVGKKRAIKESHDVLF